jgi:hypothetical protein
MDLLFIRVGLLVCSALILVAIVWLAVRSPLFYALAELVAMFGLMFAGLLFGAVGAIMLEQLLPLLVGAMISMPTTAICWPHAHRKLDELHPLPPLWS